MERQNRKVTVPNITSLLIVILFNFQHYVGALELYGTRDDAIQEIRSNQFVRYRVRFPLQNPLPKLTQLSVNGQVMCTGAPGMLELIIKV